MSNSFPAFYDRFSESLFTSLRGFTGHGNYPICGRGFLKWSDIYGWCYDDWNKNNKWDEWSVGYQVACAQLCGTGHSVMVNPFIVHNNSNDFKEWLSNKAGSVETDDW